MKQGSGQDKGQVVVISGPSGVGKGTICRGLLQRLERACVSVSATTRPQSPQEVDGRDYYFMTRQEFEERLDQGLFLEHAEVFGNYYGTPKDKVAEAIAAGQIVLLDIDVQGGRQIKAALPEAKMVFIMPPSLEALTARLTGRGRDDAEAMARRQREAAEEMAVGREHYEYLVTNDDLGQAVQQVVAIIQSDSQGEGEKLN